MALEKVLGTETEYGITVRNQAEYNPVLASSTLINSYRGGRARIQWSFDEESPGRDARGFGYEESLPIELETGLDPGQLSDTQLREPHAAASRWASS